MNDNKRNDMYTFRGINLNSIRNRNELRVIALLPEVLNEYLDYEPKLIDIQDIYALSLNLLPAFYTQEFSIVLKNKPEDKHVRDALCKAIEIVQGNPTSK
jgi:hypothetical protein